MRVRHIRVLRKSDTWFVHAGGAFGPFRTQERALIAANGLAAVFRANGDAPIVALTGEPTASVPLTRTSS